MAVLEVYRGAGMCSFIMSGSIRLHAEPSSPRKASLHYPLYDNNGTTVRTEAFPLSLASFQYSYSVILLIYEFAYCK